MRQHTLTKAERLKSRKLIEALFSGGSSLNRYPVRALYQVQDERKEGGSSIQAGFAVSKRHFKKAVDRNRVKRLMREAYRVNRMLLNSSGKPVLLFFIFTGKALPVFKEVEASLIAILKQLAGKLEK